MSSDEYEQGRGAQINPSSRYDQYYTSHQPELEDRPHSEDNDRQKTEYIDVFPKSILTKNNSPDVGFDWSINPYQGCEHGCTYCYARSSHQYWSYGPGKDFEQKVLVKRNAAELLEKKFKSSQWDATKIMLSGNTDCYQPAERDQQITRSLLEVFLKYRHPVSIITKNSLVLRDLDILKQLAKHQLVHVAVSLTTLNEDLRRKMEPRTASGKKRLRVIETLSQNNIPVVAMLAPIIPTLNESEIPSLVSRAAEAGAWDIHHLVVRLNGEVKDVFQDWVHKAMPERAEKVLHQIAQCHGGQCNDSRFGTRMRGEGPRAEIIEQQVETAKRRWLERKELPDLNTSLHEQFKDGQLDLFYER